MADIRLLNNPVINQPSFTVTPLGGLAIAKPWDNSRMFDGVDAFATFSFDISNNPKFSPTHPVTFLNTQTKQPALTVNLLSDPGADYTTLNQSRARELGILDLRTGVSAKVTGTGGTVPAVYYMHPVDMKIGSLKPVQAVVAFGPQATEVIGRVSGLSHFNVTYSDKYVRYQEKTAFSLYASRTRWDRGRRI